MRLLARRQGRDQSLQFTPGLIASLVHAGFLTREATKVKTNKIACIEPRELEPERKSYGESINLPY